MPEEKRELGALTLVEWEAEEYEHHEKPKEWYWAVGIVALGFLVLAVILKNFLFAILVILAWFTLIMYAARRPKTLHFAVTSRGIKVADWIYPYQNLEHFWINYDPPHVRQLYLISKKTFSPLISIPLGHADPNEIREHLLKFLEEKEIEESLFDVIARFFRF